MHLLLEPLKYLRKQQVEHNVGKWVTWSSTGVGLGDCFAALHNIPSGGVSIP